MARYRMVGVPGGLAAMYGAGAPIMLVGRYSSPHGHKARRAAVQDLCGAADALAEFGVDIRPDLPPADVMIEQLRSATPIRSVGQDGRSFSNRFVVIDLRARHGVYVILSVGTGRKLDDASTQPFVTYVAESLRSIGACLLLGRRIDRITRRAWALAPVMLFLGERGGFIGDKRYGIRAASGVDSLLVFFSAQNSEADAEKLPAQTRDGMRARTAAAMSAGGCSYAVAHVAPPGFMTYRSRVNGALGGRILAFDTPACWPPLDEVAVGLPEVAPHARPVDQVANVRWALSRLGRPEWPVERIAAGLWRRSYSTEGMRRLHGPCAKLSRTTAGQEPSRALQSLLANLDLYETGVLHLELGVEGQAPIEIIGCFPPDGPWAAPADFARIRRWLASRVSRKRLGLALAGLSVTVDGEECVLITVKGAGGKPRELAPVLAGPYREESRQLSPGAAVRLDPNQLHAAIVQAFVAADSAALALLPDEPGEIELMAAADLARARAAVQVLLDEQRAIREQVAARDETGSPLITGALLRDLSNRFEQIDGERLPAAQALVDKIEADITEARRRRAKESRAVSTEHLLSVVAALRDPFDCTHRQLLLSALHNATITTEPHTSPSSLRPPATMSFELRVGDDAHTAVVPGRLELAGAPARGDGLDVDQLVADICAGTFLIATAEPNRKRLVTRALAQRLGVDGRRMMLANVTDPRLARLAALALFDQRPLTEVAAEVGEPLPLLQRVHRLHRHAARAVWRGAPRPLVTAWFDAASAGSVITETDLVPQYAATWQSARNVLYANPWRNQWEYLDGGYRLKPCDRCGSFDRRPMRIPEPAGLVCLACRTDQAGFLWPAEPYDRFIAATRRRAG